jgi:hypothetical protein
VRGEQFAVALSLLCNGRPVLGLLGCPNLPPQLPAAAADRNGHVRKAADGVGSLFWASDGGGAHACSLADADKAPHVGLAAAGAARRAPRSAEKAVAAAVLGLSARLSVSPEASAEKLVLLLTKLRYVGLFVNADLFHPRVFDMFLCAHQLSKCFVSPTSF